MHKAHDHLSERGERKELSSTQKREIKQRPTREKDQAQDEERKERK